jgi:hypothetical protein
MPHSSGKEMQYGKAIMFTHIRLRLSVLMAGFSHVGRCRQQDFKSLEKKKLTYSLAGNVGMAASLLNCIRKQMINRSYKCSGAFWLTNS